MRSLNLHRLRLTHIFHLAFTLAFSTLLQAQQASLNGETLLVPELSVGNQFYRAEFALVTDSDPPIFVLSDVSELPEGDFFQIFSIYKDGTLSIPEIKFLDRTYWAELSLISLEPIQFQLTSAFEIFESNFSNNGGVHTNILVDNVSVIDATGSDLQPAMSVLVANGIIQSIRPFGEIAPPGDTIVIDGTGKYLIPGLWDMHVHVDEPNMLRLFIANGVTSVRQMYGEHSRIEYTWRERAGQIDFIAPRFSIGSTTFNGPDSGNFHLSIDDAAEAIEQVNYFYNLGADFIKVYNGLSRESFFAIAEEANRLGFPFSGHVPDSVTPEEASLAGQRSIEHLTDIATFTVAGDFLSLQEEVYGNPELGEVTSPTIAQILQLQARVYAEHDEAKASQLYETFIQNSTWQIPTLMTTRNRAYIRDIVDSHAELTVYVPDLTLNLWNIQTAIDNSTTSHWLYRERVFANRKETLASMNTAGVGILAGSDAGTLGGSMAGEFGWYIIPGFSLHEELELLVEAGLSEMEALQAATSSAALFSEQSNLLGTVEKGKLADLILLGSNPLIDIRNTTDIDAVIFNGQLRDRVALDQMLDQVRAGYGK